MARGLARAFWVCALIGHAPALLTACGRFLANPLDADLVLRSAALATATVFFLLKILDLPQLRLVRDWQSLLAMTVVVSLLHAGVMHRAARDGQAVGFQPFAAVLIGGGLVALSRAAVRAARAVGQLRIRQWQRTQRAVLHTRLVELLAWRIPPRFLLLSRACALNRAPPR